MRRLAPLILLVLCSAAARAELTPTVDSPPVILIVVDTLRADHLGTYGYARFSSPEIDAYARQGAVFEHAYAPSPWTLPTMASLFTGLMPSQHGAGTLLPVGNKTLYAALRGDPPTLAARFNALGYASHAIAGNPNLHPRFNVLNGFATVDYRAGDMQLIRRADVMVDRAIHWIRARHGAPFFLFLHLFDPHMNYDPPPAVRGRFTAGMPAGRVTLPFAESLRLRAGKAVLTQEEQAFVAAAYDEEIAFVDIQLGRLFAGLHAAGLWGRAIVVLTADHGEELWDHNGFEHGHTLYDELLRVPLIVWGPGVVPGRVDTPVSLIDLPPTLLAALRAPPLPANQGQSLWPLLGRNGALPERALAASNTRYGPERAALVRWPYKAIVTLDGSDEQLFDLSADPGERRNVSAAQPAKMAALRGEINAGLARPRTQPTPAAVTLDAATREQLRALGYME